MTPKVSIVTVTLNAGKVIDELIESLMKQSDQEYVWVIQDGGSQDDTLEKVKNSGLPIDLVSEKDFGIYDAMNKAVARVKTDYYLVMGADDRLEPDAIRNYRGLAAKTGCDFIAATIKAGDRMLSPMIGKGWLYGMPGEASGHSVGLLIRTDTHRQYGWYSKSFPIVADQYFVKNALNSGASIFRSDFFAGYYAETGFSSASVVQFIFEFSAMQIRTEKYKVLQLFIFFIRVLKNWTKIFNEQTK